MDAHFANILSWWGRRNWKKSEGTAKAICHKRNFDSSARSPRGHSNNRIAGRFSMQKVGGIESWFQMLLYRRNIPELEEISRIPHIDRSLSGKTSCLRAKKLTLFRQSPFMQSTMYYEKFLQALGLNPAPHGASEQYCDDPHPNPRSHPTEGRWLCPSDK